MIAREQVIEIAGSDKFCSTEYEDYTHECYEFSESELIVFAAACYSMGVTESAAEIERLKLEIRKLDKLLESK